MANRFLFILLLLLQLICLGVLWISCFPGELVSLLFILFWLLTIYGIPLLVLLVVIILVGMQILKKINFFPKDQTLLTTAIITVGLTVILLLTNLPQTVAFSMSRPAFEAIIVNADKLNSICNSKPINQQLGFYRVIECDRDSRGGIYFSTGNFRFIDISDFYGFAYQPNPYGSYHFGSDIYEYYPIVGEWYRFTAGKRS
ncbi:hypothetical protein [Pseudanabaena biceps]|uniref:Uncharacterized protein n=1 Tax=Pseudanabaena biceps PCC 7429 TaxID=927668 RepID=L8N1F6_9CYAN|nr:hypothetical protein [Pseudanabaena biceps]ELS32088.1 hypothetical protein Pse7429DRAFT_2710 [Pseudanabaena biceps PCC 7429]